MQKELLDRLKIQTQERQDYHNKHTSTSIQQEYVKLQINKDPNCLSATYFFLGDAPMFMSFHDEAGNLNQHYHDFFEINYVLKGHPVGVIDGKEIHFTEGSLYIMNPNAVHYFKSYSDSSDLILNIGFTKETFQNHFFTPLIGNPTLNAFFIRYCIENSQQPSFIYLDKPDSQVDNFIELLLQEYLDKKNYTEVVIDSLITLLFSFILRSYKGNLSSENNPISDILNYVYQQYHDCSLNHLADTFNYHPKYLSSLIHKYTGQSYRDLITNIRLHNSLHFLLYTDYSIDHIISAVGYTEKSSFYSSFKKKYHTSPKAYRLSHSNR